MRLFWRKLLCGFLGHAVAVESAVDWLDEERRPRFRREYRCARRCGWVLTLLDLETEVELAVEARLAREKEGPAK